MATYTINHFRGLADFSSPTEQGALTRSLSGVIVRRNRIFGWLGLDELRNILTVSPTTPVIGLGVFSDPDLTSKLVRITPTAIEWLNTAGDTWDVITGTAFTGASTDQPQSAMHKSTFCLANGAVFRPRKWTGTGNTAVLGGTPPFAKAIADNWGFLFLFNISDDGITFFPRRAVYSDDFDNSWSTCDGAELNFNETNGEIVNAGAFGDVIVVCKSDVFIQLRFVGGETRFTQFPLEYQGGLLAPLSLSKVGRHGLVGLDTSYRLVLTDGQSVEPLPPFVAATLENDLVKASAKLAIGFTYPDDDTYNLICKTNAADTWNTTRLTFNFRTGEFNKREYDGHQFIRALTYRNDTTEGNIIAASTNDLVWQLDTLDTNDNGTVVNRRYDVDWDQLNFIGEKVVTGATLHFKKNVGSRVALSVARDFEPTFNYRKVFDLRGNPQAGEFVVVPYRIDPGLKGEFFKLRIEFLQDDGVQIECVPPVQIHYEPVTREMLIDSRSKSATQT